MTDPLRELNHRERKYVENRAKGMNKRQAALNAGYSHHMASAVVAKVERPAVKDAFARLMRQYVPAHRIAKRIQEGLDAMETKFFQKDGRITDSADVINWSERRAYAELAAEFGEYTTKEATTDQSNVAIGLKVIIEHVGAARDQDTLTA